jgi:hypothetical protein
LNVKVRIPSVRNGDTNTSYTVPNTSIGRSMTEIDDPDVDEFGRRKRNPQVNVGTQDTINREPTSRASSSLTNITAVNNINAGWGYGGYSAYGGYYNPALSHPYLQNQPSQAPPQPYSFQLQDNGERVSIDQLNHLLRAIESQNYHVISTTMQSILAFHNPVHGIKQMIDGHLELLNRTIREGIEAGCAVPNPEPESTNQNIRLYHLYPVKPVFWT